jgi:hypothetical protein
VLSNLRTTAHHIPEHKPNAAMSDLSPHCQTGSFERFIAGMKAKPMLVKFCTGIHLQPKRETHAMKGFGSEQPVAGLHMAQAMARCTNTHIARSRAHWNEATSRGRDERASHTQLPCQRTAGQSESERLEQRIKQVTAVAHWLNMNQTLPAKMLLNWQIAQ